MANEKRLISLDEALKATRSEIYWTESQQAAVRLFLVQQPRVDAMEVVNGRWVKDEEASKNHIEAIYSCSACQNHDAWGEMEKTNYCPHCGAKMDGE